jgi:DNA-binding GntR family transcriptional regulator
MSASTAEQPANTTRIDIVQGILDLIVSNDIHINQMTSEKELAGKLNLNGRSPALREALALLTRDAIVQPRPQRGYFVRGVSQDEAREILRLRAASERVVVEKLATLELGERLNRAWGLHGELSHRARLNDCASFVKLEGRFWCELSRLGHLFIATQAIGAWSDQLRVFHASVPLEQEQMEQVSEGDSDLLASVEGHDAVRAVEILDTQLDVRMEAVEATPEIEIDVPQVSYVGALSRI